MSTDPGTPASARPPTPGTPTPQGPDRAPGTPTPQGPDRAPGAQARVVDLLSTLVRFDTSNPTSTERPAAEWAAALLADAGLDVVVRESAPGRTSLVTRIAGLDRTRPALLLHGHLDVVPAEAADWQVPPFAGEVVDGYVWGRGAVDMKDMVAMSLAVVLDRLATGRPPARDVVLTLLADEEAGGRLGAHWLVDHHRDLLEGCDEAIGEVGGFSVTVAGRRLYLVESAQKGIAWLRLVAEGRAGHGSMLNEDNAVTALARAVAAIGGHAFPVTVGPTVAQLLRTLADAVGVAYDPADPAAVLPHVGGVARLIGATLHDTANPTGLAAGYKTNVIPQRAIASVDGRFLPGRQEAFLAAIDALLPPGVRRETEVLDIAVETAFEGSLVTAMTASLLAEDPGAAVAPYMLSCGTDLKAFTRLGMRGYGFAPLRLPADLDFTALFHGVDERVPIDALRFGVRVLDRLLDAC